MIEAITSKLYQNDVYLNYLRYNPKWYLVLDKNPNLYSAFEKEVKTNLKLTTYDKIENFRKQLNFINSLIKYINSN